MTTIATSLDDTLNHRTMIKRHTGVIVRLLPFDQIVDVKITADQVTVLIMTHKVDERRTDYYFRSQARKLIALTRNDDGTWATGKAIVIEVTDFEPFAINKFGPGRTVLESIQREQHARMAHRVGTDAQPMDSFFRACSGATPARMSRHWKV